MKNEQYPSPGAVGYAGQHPAIERIDWTQAQGVGTEHEHLDELEDDGAHGGMDPYASTQAAQRVTTPEPVETHAGVGLVRDETTRYGLAPTKQGVQVRPVTATDWSPNSFFLTDGAQSVALAPKDPYRTAITIRNHTDGDVYLSSSNVRTVGAGVMLLPARDAGGYVHEVTMKHCEQVWLFTLAAFAVGASQRPVCTSVERWG